VKRKKPKDQQASNNKPSVLCEQIGQTVSLPSTTSKAVSTLKCTNAPMPSSRKYPKPFLPFFFPRRVIEKEQARKPISSVMQMFSELIGLVGSELLKILLRLFLYVVVVSSRSSDSR